MKTASDYGEEPYNWPLEDREWHDNYRCNRVVIIDDFRGSLPFNTLLRYLDRYPVSLPVRGRAPRPFMATHIYITSHMHPRDVYSSEKIQEAIEQLLRRISEIWHYEKTPIGFIRTKE